MHRLEEALKRNGCCDSHADFPHLYVKHKRCIELLRYNNRAGSDVSDRMKFKSVWLLSAQSLIQKWKANAAAWHEWFWGETPKEVWKKIYKRRPSAGGLPLLFFFFASIIMKFSAILPLGFAALAAAADSSRTVTVAVTANGATYTKTRTEKLTGQATTTPTSGTYTTTIVIEGDDATYTKTATETYGLESVSTTHLTVEQDSATYTKTLSSTVPNSSAIASASSEASLVESENSSSSSDGAAGNFVAVGGVAAAAAALLL